MCGQYWFRGQNDGNVPVNDGHSMGHLLVISNLPVTVTNCGQLHRQPASHLHGSQQGLLSVPLALFNHCGLSFLYILKHWLSQEESGCVR